MTDGRKKRRTSLAEMWRSYEEQTIPADAGRVQRTAMRYAFYAAAAKLLQTMNRELGDEDQDEEEGAAVMQAWLDEARAFFASELRRTRD